MKLSTIVAAVAIALLPAAAIPAQPQSGRLVFAVVVTRHGVRSISKAPPQYSWADWQPVAPSYLTARGYRLMTYMGQFYRVYFGANGISLSCTAPNVYLYADKDQRTLETGLALIEGMCGKADAMPMHHAADLTKATDDPLFDAAGWAASEHRIDAAASRDAVEAAAPKPPSDIVSKYAADFAGLQKVLDTRCSGTCAPVAGGASSIADDDGLTELGGPLKTASGYAEDLFLEYAQCNPDASSDLADAMRLHVLAYDVNARNSYNPLVRGGTLFAHIVGMLEAKAGRAHPGVDIPDISRDDVVIFSGHDTQLGALGGILDAHWQPGGGIVADDMPPGGALIFGLYKTSENQYRVRARFAYETMDQFHHYKLVDNGVGNVPVHIAGCDGTDCSVPLDRLSALSQKIQNQRLVRKQWTPESTDAVNLDQLYNPKWTQCAS